MRGFLIWALLILLVETGVRLASLSLAVVIPLSVVENLRRGSDLGIVAAGLTAAVAVFLYVQRKRLSRADIAKTGWLLLALLVTISVVALGTEDARGYVVLGQPAGRLSRAIAIGSLVLAGAALWRGLENRSRRAGFAAVMAGGVGSAALIPATLAVLLPASLVACAAAAIRARDAAMLRARWFEFSLLTLAAVTALATMARSRGQ